MIIPAKIFPAIIILASLLLSSCNVKPGVIEPIESNGTIENTNPLPEKVKPLLEGIYRITEGSSVYGQYAAVKLIRNHLCICCSGNNAYLILNSGERDSSFLFEGFWRFSQNTRAGKSNLMINRYKGAGPLLSGRKPETIQIEGSYMDEDGKSAALKFEYLRPLKSDTAFYIIAHRGGGRNSDRLQASENSLEILRLAEYYGANSVEIDVQLTKDNVPILFHDEEFTQRLIKGNYLIGSVSSFSFRQIRTFGRLIYDEKIPTLEEALNVILRETTLQLVWLDVKNPEAVALAAELQKKYTELAGSLKRDLKIIIGLPDEYVQKAYMQLSDFQFYPSLSELDITQTRKSNSEIWAPRFTDGIARQQIISMQAEKRKVFVWTLDIPELIQEYITSGYYDGILTNYPSIVAWEYYMRA